MNLFGPTDGVGDDTSGVDGRDPAELLLDLSELVVVHWAHPTAGGNPPIRLVVAALSMVIR